MYRYYKCPLAVSDRLGLTESRRQTEDGCVILNSADLLTYPLDVAILDGAVEVSADEARALVCDSLNKR